MGSKGAYNIVLLQIALFHLGKGHFVTVKRVIFRVGVGERGEERERERLLVWCLWFFELFFTNFPFGS